MDGSRTEGAPLRLRFLWTADPPTDLGGRWPQSATPGQLTHLENRSSDREARGTFCYKIWLADAKKFFCVIYKHPYLHDM